MKVTKKIQDIDGITAFPCRSNVLLIKHFNGKKINNSIQELKQIYKEFNKKLLALMKLQGNIYKKTRSKKVSTS